MGKRAKEQLEHYEGLEVSADTTSRVKAHAEFFDSLVNRIPAKFYAPAQSNPEWQKYEHRQSDKVRQSEVREAARQAKRAKLDPENAKSTEEMIEVRATEDDDDEDEDEDEDEGDEEEEEAEILDDDDQASRKRKIRPVSHAVPTAWNLEKEAPADLQGRLKRKIEEAREKRKAEERTKAVKSAKEWRNKKVGADKKDRGRKKELAAQGSKMEGEEANGNEAKLDTDSVNLDLLNSRVVTGKGERKRGVSMKKKLEKAVAVQGVLEEKGEKAARHVWSSAERRAAGEKVLDDPKLLKKAMKLQEKKRKKGAEAWEKRTAQEKETVKAKQDKRSGNLKARKDAKTERRIAKRQKKMLRPGFEGRKEGMIN